MQTAIADIIVEYSALLAQNHDEVTTPTPGVIGHEHGVIYVDAATQLLSADLAPDAWLRSDTGAAVDVVGKAALVDAIASADNEYSSLVDAAMVTLWGGTDNLDWLSAALTDASTSVAVEALPGVTLGKSQGAMLVAGAGNDMLVGTGSNDLLIGGGGADTLDGGTGNNIMVGGVGATYLYRPGDGSDVIVNGVASSSKPTGTLDFGSAATPDNFWFVKSGNDLQIDLLGSHQQVTIADWFAGGSHQLQEIQAGGLELDGGVAQLVQAMAVYASAHPGFDPTVASQMPSDPHLHDVIAGAWHINA